MRKMKVAELVIDFDIYPRNNVDAHNVRCIMDAIIAGIELPPMICDRASKRLVDGVHRARAYLRLDPNAEAMVIEKTYHTEADLFLDAMRYNAAHGARLDSCDRTRCGIIAERLSIPIDAVAGALHMPVDKLAGLKSDRTARTSSGLSIALKRTIQHMSGRRMTKAQNDANEKLSGMNQQFYVNQLITLIENELLDTSDERLMKRLDALHKLLDGILAAV